eukprot:365122-Chlamydomonas_euryale.AAC.6
MHPRFWITVLFHGQAQPAVVGLVWIIEIDFQSPAAFLCDLPSAGADLADIAVCLLTLTT